MQRECRDCSLPDGERVVWKRSFLAEKATKGGEKSRRLRERFALSLPVRIHCRESIDHEWVQMSRLVDVTPFGARLRLSRPTEIGRLLHLTLPMPRPLRCFDHVEDQYRVWSLVRNLELLDPGAEKGALVEIGVAFVGKRPPQVLKAIRRGATRSCDRAPTPVFGE